MKNGWKAVRFEDCVKVITPPRKVPRKAFLDAGEFPVVSQESGLVNGYWDDHADLVPAGDSPVVVFGDHTKAVKYVDFDFVVGADGVKILKPCEALLPRFFYYAVDSIPLRSLGYARHFRLLRESIIPIPSLPEQRRIVAILDEAFEGIATAKANAEQNLRNAREMFKARVAKAFCDRDGDWIDATLETLAENLDSKRIPITKSKRQAGEYPYYGASGVVDFVKDFIFDGDCLLVSEDGANLLMRSTPIAFSVSGKYWVNNHAHILRFPDMATQRYVEFYLESIPIDRYVTGAAQPKLTQRAMNAIPIPIPKCAARRKEIVDLISKMDSFTADARHSFESKVNALGELKASLLHQAFSGAL